MNNKQQSLSQASCIFSELTSLSQVLCWSHLKAGLEWGLREALDRGQRFQRAPDSLQHLHASVGSLPGLEDTRPLRHGSSRQPLGGWTLGPSPRS